MASVNISPGKSSKDGLVQFLSLVETEAPRREAGPFGPHGLGDLGVCTTALKGCEEEPGREQCPAADTTFTEIICQGKEGEKQQ